jgi:hypothetical protein
MSSQVSFACVVAHKAYALVMLVCWLGLSVALTLSAGGQFENNHCKRTRCIAVGMRMNLGTRYRICVYLNHCGIIICIRIAFLRVSFPRGLCAT